MSDADRSIPGRLAAFDAVVQMALEEAADDSSGGGLYRYRSDIQTADVADRVEADVSDRTVLRALKDAAALGWVTDERQGWDVGPLAEDVAPDPEGDRVTVCEECTAVWQGLASSCAECGSEKIRQCEPGDPDRTPI